MLDNRDPKKIILREPKQIIVEGNDEVRVFYELSKHLGISDIQVHPTEGYTKLRGFLRTFIALPNFRTIKSMAIVADANSNRAGKNQSIQSALESAKLPVPLDPLMLEHSNGIAVAYLIIPHDAEGAMLEDVCLASVEADPAMACVEQYLSCVAQSGGERPRDVWMPKARLHAFLASRDDPSLRLGEAANKGIWRFDDSAFDPLKSLLQML